MKFILLINVKMPSIVDFFTFISIIVTTSESLKARSLYFSAFYFYEYAVEMSCSAELRMKKSCITFGPGHESRRKFFL